MTDYTPSGNPFDDTRGIAKQIRDEFISVQSSIKTKADRFAYTTSSLTSLVIGAGSKTLTVESGKDFASGMNINISDSNSPTNNYMTGKIVSYDAASGNLTANITGISGSGTKSSWVVSLSNDNGVTLVSNSFSGYQNFSRAVVASSATTSDIWNALGNQIDFTGTAVVTSFPNAQQAGSFRELICSGACSFTASPAMLIDGVQNGSTVTCAANDIVVVRAIGISMFRLTRHRYDGRPQREVTDSVVIVHTGNGYGSTNTKIRRFTTALTNTGTAITYADSATLGASFVINENGLYEIFYQEVFSSTSYTKFGASLNSNQLTTDITGVTVSSRIFCASVGGAATTGDANSSSRVMLLNSGDIVRPHGLGVTTSTSDQTLFSLRKIANV